MPITKHQHWLSRRARILAQLCAVPQGAHFSATLIDSQTLEGPVFVLASGVGAIGGGRSADPAATSMPMTPTPQLFPRMHPRSEKFPASRPPVPE